jgi:hypothetical protein
MGGSIRDDRPPAMPDLHQTSLAQRLDGLPNSRTADSKLLGQFMLRRQLITYFEITRDNSLFDLIDDLFVQAFRLNR